jgi:two-component system KDP operon response regulator KdpE
VKRVLVVDDEHQIRRYLRAALGAQGYEVLEAASVQEAITIATSARPDLVILDLGLPDGDGLSVVQKLREWTETPILILSVRGQEVDKVSALDAGADDYLVKPFNTGELLARIRAAMRRASRGEDEEPVFRTGGLSVDRVHRTVTVDDVEVHLTATEYTLLKTFVQHASKVITHKHLLTLVWGPGYEAETHMLRVNVSNLRRKIEPSPLQPQYIVTEPGVGYRLRVGPGG